MTINYKLLDDIIKYIKLEEIKAPPQVCYTCVNLTKERKCLAFGESPPLEALSRELNCPEWQDDIPF